MNTVFRDLGSGIGAPIAGSLFSTSTASVAIESRGGETIHETLPTTQAFQYAFDISAVGTVKVIMISFRDSVSAMNPIIYIPLCVAIILSFWVSLIEATYLTVRTAPLRLPVSVEKAAQVRLLI